MKYKDITGLKFSRLEVLEYKGSTGKPYYQIRWLCKCNCGNTIITDGGSLRSGNTNSCGCYNRERSTITHYKHGLKDTRINKIHSMMKQRCNNPNHTSYKNYGERGITYCKEWESVENFNLWAINNGYSSELSLERINVDGNYEPSNCKWIPIKDQILNMRKTLRIIENGKTILLSDICKENPKITKKTFMHRIFKMKLTIQEAIDFKYNSKPRKKI